VALARFDYLRVPEIASVPALVASLAAQLGGFLCLVVSWNVVLARGKCPVRFAEGLAALGLSIFGNYVPGKIWLIVGRAGYVAARHDYALGRLSVLSLHAQLVALWAGLALGTVGAFAVGGLGPWGALIGALWLALTLTVFSGAVHALVARVLGALAGRHLSVPRLSIRATSVAVAWALVAWLLWSAAFYAFLRALGVDGIDVVDGLGFPLAATLGVVALIAPGGLGAREAVLAGYLILSGCEPAQATTAAVAARLWYLAGETALFLIGWGTHRLVVAEPDGVEAGSGEGERRRPGSGAT
ncbi:MAG: lysylphosphatidylglycerol synthase transmembrane domain-containing protein, partial [Gammaproteobacteria bacterium]|nr:lysylphosphatidylglycerol synthase transmembrane domain-containing protein [Gammaproteobacteria bacterium]